MIGETRTYRRKEPDTHMDADIGAPRRDGQVTRQAETAGTAAAADLIEAAGERNEPRGRPRVRRPRETWSKSRNQSALK